MIQTETRVNKLPVKLLIPLVFCVFPSLSVILIGPAMLNVYNSLPDIIKQNEIESARKITKGISKTANVNVASVTALISEEPKAESGLDKSIILTPSPKEEKPVGGN